MPRQVFVVTVIADPEFLLESDPLEGKGVADQEALFREAKRRARTRRLLWLGATCVVVGSAVAGYTISEKTPLPGSESLLTRPLHFPSLPAGASCQATPGKPVQTSFFEGVALGSGPVKVLIADRGDLRVGRAVLGISESPGWFVLQTLWFSVPSYDGQFVVRAKVLGSHGPAR